MKATLLSLVFAAAALAQSQGPTINTPGNVAQCEPTLLTFSGGQQPYFALQVFPGATPDSGLMETIASNFTGTSLTWLVNIQSGLQISLTLKDATGATGQTAPFSIDSGSSNACLSQSVSASAGTAAPPAQTNPPSGGSTAAPANTTPSPNGTSAPNGSSNTAPRPTSASGSASGSASTTNAASANFAQMGTAGVIGAALAALLA